MSVAFLDFDTDGDGIADYRMVGDYNRNGILEWDDIQMALDTFCDPNGDGVQDARDGKMKDPDGSGIKQPFCGTLHILPGVWVSRTQLDSNIYHKKDDQIYLSQYQGLVFRGSGIGSTVLKTVYSRQEFCRKHHQPGCGGVCSEGTLGNLTISDFTFEGLEPRTWMEKRDCDGDGLPYTDPQETDYKVRTHQSVIVVNSAPGVPARNVKVHNVEVTQADYNGFVFGDIQNLHLANLSVGGAGACGFMLSGIQNSLAQNLRAENCDNGIGAGVCIFSWPQETGRPAPLKTHRLVIDGLISRHNHYGLSLSAFGVGGISEVTIRNFDISESRDRTGATIPFTQFGVRILESCLWDGDGDGRANDPCYATNLTFESGRIVGCPGHSISFDLQDRGPDRNYILRNIHFEGNGHGHGEPDSRDVDLWKIPGVIFEGNTLLGGDYNRDGRPDVAWLLLAGGKNQTIRNNKFLGAVRPEGWMVHLASPADSVFFQNNTLESLPGPGFIGVFASSAARNITIEGNSISLAGVNGVGILDLGENSAIDNNAIWGGNMAIDARGRGTSIRSNRTSTLDPGPPEAEIRIGRPVAHVADNVCRPLQAGKYCIEILNGADNPTLSNNSNLTSPEKVYLYR